MLLSVSGTIYEYSQLVINTFKRRRFDLNKISKNNEGDDDLGIPVYEVDNIEG